MAVIQTFLEGDAWWFGIVILFGAAISAVPAAIGLAILLISAKRLRHNPLPFALLGPPIVIAVSEWQGLGFRMAPAQVAIIGSIVFYALAYFRGQPREPDPY